MLADIQLADGSSGLDAVNEILTEIEVPVIFITAFPERLLTGEKPEPAFLITKPFRPEAVKAAISQALFFDRKASRRAVLRLPAPMTVGRDAAYSFSCPITATELATGMTNVGSAERARVRGKAFTVALRSESPPPQARWKRE